ncbi:hypothetical protein ACFLS1_02580 [Verrucomicrobiota bacterium]
MGKKFFKAKKLTIAQQAYSLRSLYPEALCNARREHLDWTGVLIPTPLSSSYVVNIVYMKGWHPKTFVREPKLDTISGKRLPHVYNHDEQRLCLYFSPDSKEWNSSMSIARTIVPWASEWLYFYELWLATGEWLGGGIHIESPKEEPEQDH